MCVGGVFLGTLLGHSCAPCPGGTTKSTVVTTGLNGCVVIRRSAIEFDWYFVRTPTNCPCGNICESL